ncbi:MAG: dephospho-CoA kinase [Brevinemataceae bacterium]
MRYIIGIFGKAGSGKTTVSRYFFNLGWEVINQDMLGHEVLIEHPSEIAELFGQDVLHEGIVDRALLGRKVFSDQKLLKILIDFSYPIIIEKTNNKLFNSVQNTVIEGAFFYKIKESVPYTHMIYLYVNDQLLRERLLKRGHTKEWIQKVLDSQKEIEQHSFLADTAIDNSKGIEELYAQLDQFKEQYHIN